MSSEAVKLRADDEMVELAKWCEVINSIEFQTTVLKEIDKRVSTLRQNKAVILQSNSTGVDLAVEILRLEDRINELELLKKTFDIKARKYERKLKGE